MPRLAMVASIAVMFSQSAGAQIYTCKPDFAAGFVFNEQAHAWQGTTFVVGQPFRIRRLTESEQADKIGAPPPGSGWGVLQGDDKYPLGYCPNDDVAPGAALPAILMCRGAYDLLLNRDNRRFQAEYSGGYVHGLDNNDDTPLMTIGRCSVAWVR